jgi:mono/diheme cytochrome c family protein
MAEIQLLGLLHEASPTADAIEQLHEFGVSDDQITILSSIPYRPEILGRPKPTRRVGLISLIGAVLGLLTGVFLTAGIFLLYPLIQGGQPIVPIPPTLIVLFEATMLGTMWAAFFGLLHANVFPIFKSQVYDPRITEGHIGIVVRVDESQAEEAEKILVENGAHHMRREPYVVETDYRRIAFRVAVPAGLVILAGLILLVAYDVIKAPIPSNMVDQNSIAYVQGPRLSAPEAAVPVQGPVLIAGRPASEPLPVTQDSLQRGGVLFGLTCAVCHGPGGNGNSPVGSFFNPRPADLTSQGVKQLSDDQIFLVVTQGRGVMPSISENLGVQDRWDVINYVRSLEK